MELLTNKYKKMRKLYILLIVFAACLLAGCDENGESGYYEDIDRVYFVKDSLICRLGEMLMDVETYTLQVPVKVLGEPLGESRKFKVNVNKDYDEITFSCHQSDKGPRARRYTELV